MPFWGDSSSNSAATTFVTPFGKDIRVVMVEGEPWFVAKDVCEALGLAGNFNSIRTLTTDERKALDKRTCPDHALFPGTTARINTISESGLYKLVMRSDKPQALAFQNWVTKEVLPAIRKDGAYVMGEEKVKSVRACSSLVNKWAELRTDNPLL